MDRRTLLAVVLVAIVIVGTPLVFPGARPPKHVPIDGAVDTTIGIKAPELGVGIPPANPTKTPAIPLAVSPQIVAESTVVQRGSSHVVLSSLGGSLSHVQLLDYRTLDKTTSGTVDLRTGARSSLIGYTVVMGKDSLNLSGTVLERSHEITTGSETVTYMARVGEYPVSVAYSAPTDTVNRYLLHVKVMVRGAPANTTLHISLPTTLASSEADTADDIRHLAVAWKPSHGDVENVLFAKQDSGTSKVVPGGLEWVAVRNKYFVVALLTHSTPISALIVMGQPKEGALKLARYATSKIVLPVTNDTAGFDLYAGPQEFERLQAAGRDLDQVNPTAGWAHTVVQPFSTVVMRILLWMKRTTNFSYGWVIVIFGVVIRILLWPLNQNAMRTSIRMQRIQPELTETQERFKNDPEKQRDALVKLYQAHGMTPFSPILGCLPMLLPMPILWALFYVFQNTIEFRGVSFLWLPDISAADPYFIIPILMGLSMFALSWIGMRGTPPTAQMKMMSYAMPVMMTFFFFRLASGLNLYYAVQNFAAIPQQWMLSKERIGAKTAPVINRSKPAPKPTGS